MPDVESLARELRAYITEERKSREQRQRQVDENRLADIQRLTALESIFRSWCDRCETTHVHLNEEILALKKADAEQIKRLNNWDLWKAGLKGYAAAWGTIGVLIGGILVTVGQRIIDGLLQMGKPLP